MEEVSRIEYFVTDIVNGWWKDKSSAYLLSALGPVLRKNFPDYNMKLIGGLQSFCERMSTIRIVRHPDYATKIGAVPADAQVPEDIREVFDTKVEASAGPVYSDDFWRAFTRKQDDARFVNIFSDNTFEISATGRSGAKGVYEITAADYPIVTSLMPIQEKVEETHEKIKQWIDRHNLREISHIFRKGVGTSSSQGPHSSLNDLLRILSKLNEDELRRMNIPADIIVKLATAK